MATFSDIVIPDAEATPVNHTFSPAHREGRHVMWEDRSPATYVGYNRIKGWFNPPMAPNGVNYNVRGLLEMPILLAASGPTSSGYTPVAAVSHINNIEFRARLSIHSSYQERLNLLTLAANLFTHTSMIDMIANLDAPVGSS